MKVSTEIMILSISLKTNKNNEDYLIINFADINDGQTYQVITKDMQYSSLKSFTKYQGIFNLANSKYGLSLQVDNIIE